MRSDPRLARIRDRLSKKWLGGTLRPPIFWADLRENGTDTVGLYLFETRHIEIADWLQDRRVPRREVEFTIWHELVHAALDHLDGDPHGPVFWAVEALHPYKSRSDRWILTKQAAEIRDSWYDAHDD